VGLLDHIEDLCLAFKEASILFSRMVAVACIPSSSVLPTSSPTFVVGGVFYGSHFNKSVVES
jgi:hypothetical protein